MIDRYNYLLVQDFLKYLDEVKGLKENSIRRYRQLLNHLLNWADDSKFHHVMTKSPTLLSYVTNLKKNKGAILSLESQSRIIETSKRLFDWAKIHRASDFRKMPTSWIDTIQMPKTESQQAENVYVSFDEILKIARLKVESHDLVMQREQAAAVMLFLSGMRAGAFVSAPIKAFDLEQKRVYQSSKDHGVKTKNNKTATTYLWPIPELLEVVSKWNRLVSSVCEPTEPWYAPIKNEWGAQEISHAPIGKHRATALNKRLRVLFKAAGLPYKSAHKFRHGNAVYGLQQAKSMADYKAISMNLMHSDIRTTDSIYAPLLTEEVGDRIANMVRTTVLPLDADTPHLPNDLSNDDLMRLLSRRLSE